MVAVFEAGTGLAQATTEPLPLMPEILWLGATAAIVTLAVLGTIGFWRSRYLPFEGREPPPRGLAFWVLALAVAVALPAALQLAWGRIVPWWTLWLASLLAAAGIFTVIAFQRARACYPARAHGSLLALAVLSVGCLGLWWILDPRWLLLLLLLLLLLYIIWLGSVMLACARKEPAPGEGGGAAPCTASITSPIGSLSDTPVPAASWTGSAPFRFDFQGVERSSAGPYVLTISGKITPSPAVTPLWSLDAAAGSLTNETTLSPTHSAPTSAGEGDLTLEGRRGGAAAGCRDEKRVKIYPDHLARDRDNFGTGIGCLDGWTFTKYGRTITMSSAWNCFGSVDHHYDGSGTGYVAGTAMIPQGWATKTYDAPITAADWTAIESGLGRGDVVSFWSGSAAAGFQPQHAHTCRGSPAMYGANNEPSINATGRPATWKWFETTSKTYFTNVNASPRTAGLFTRVIVHTKP